MVKFKALISAKTPPTAIPSELAMLLLDLTQIEYMHFVWSRKKGRLKEGKPLSESTFIRNMEGNISHLTLTKSGRKEYFLKAHKNITLLSWSHALQG